MNKLKKELWEVTQLAAAATFPLIGSEDEYQVDKIATEIMRKQLNQMSIDGVITIGEGEMDDAPMLYIGERVGTGQGMKVDIAVDPIDGTSLVSKNESGAISVMALTERNGLLHAPDMYMKKIAVGADGAAVIDIEKSLATNIKNVSEAKNKSMKEMVIAIQDRDRHQQYFDQIRDLGAKVKKFKEVDVTPTIMTCMESSGIDLFVGIGGAPEGVIGAAGVKALKGNFQGKLLPSNNNERERCIEMGISNPGSLLELDNIIPSDKILLFASGITDGMLLEGLTEGGNEIKVHSVCIDSDCHSYTFSKDIKDKGDVNNEQE